MWVLNLSPYKEFHIPHWEQGKLQLGADIYNLFNHPAYGIPSGVINSPAGAFLGSTFVRRSTEFTESRKVVINARFIF